MKNIYISLTLLTLVSSIAFGEDNDNNSNVAISTDNTTITTTVPQQAPQNISTGDSFLIAIGMNDSSIAIPNGVVIKTVPGEAKSSVGATTVSSLASQGINPRHTPYLYTK